MHRTPRRLLLLALMVSAGWAGRLPAAASEPPRLFDAIDEEGMPAFAARPGAARSRYVDVNVVSLIEAAAAGAAPIRLNLFDDAEFDLHVERADLLPDGARLITGRLAGIEGSSVTLVLYGEVLAGAVRAGLFGTFDIRPAADGLHVVRELDLTRLAVCPGPPNAASLGRRQATTAALAGSAGVGRCDDGSVIDLLVVYTADSREAAGGAAALEALIDLAAGDTNTAFTDSEIDTSVNVVHRQEIAYAETGDWEIDGPRLVETDDGFLDDVHALRDQYGADCVSLIVETLNAGGIGYYPDPSLQGIGASGFTILRLDNLTTHIMAHELGHNLFCAHDRPNAPDVPFAEYSYGYVEPGGLWHTIMAVTPVMYIPYYSNPDLTWTGVNPGPMGVPVGQPEPSDNRLTINETRLFVANFRASHVPGLPPVLYVRADAPGGGDGTSWATAYNDLTEALCVAAGAGGAVTEVWVAAGTYLPDGGTGDREATFRLVDDVAVYGGFAGDETDLSERDAAANVTVLSGDIGIPGDEADNAYHVVTASLLGSGAVLDGFTITAGQADGADPHDGGGGVLVYGGGTPTFANCIISGNTAARFGAGMYNYGGAAPSLTSCTFDANTVTGTAWPEGGGAIHNNTNASPALTDCTLTGNYGKFGAAMANLFDSDPSLTRCVIADHAGPVDGEGGGVYNYSSCDPTLDRCVLEGNAATFGGAMYSIFDCTPVLTNCSVLGNSAINDGGGLYSHSNCLVELTNCLLSGNSASFGGGMNNLFGSDVVLVNCTLVGNTAGVAAGGVYNYESAPLITNCIFWSNAVGGAMNEAAQISGFNSTPLVNFCTIRGWSGGLGGTGNNGTNPQFRDADGPDDDFGTADDNPRLRAASAAVDSGDNAAVPPSVTTDLDGRDRILDGVVDRGAYEYAQPPPGDITGDGHVDLADHLLLADCLAGPGVAPQPTKTSAQDCLDAFDADVDSDVDLADFEGFQAEFDGGA